ncbi:MAG: AAA family ATPase [Armatimonadetes bacterium]|nr:AAA family ATPase [Armatimonadota bacterium]
MAEASATTHNWYIFKGDSRSELPLPPPPPWRRFGGEIRTPKDPASGRIPDPSPQERRRGERYQVEDPEVEMVNAALLLRRPLLVTGKPGTGKSSLAYAIAQDLELGPVLRWSVTSRSTLKDGLYTYDVLGRLQDQQLHPGSPPDISKYLRLGPLGTALVAASRPRVLLIDEIDKGDVDLPNDLLHIFEEGEFQIPELARLADGLEPVEVPAYDDGLWVPIVRGKVRCHEFPVVILTSNGEREFPPAFLRRCLRLTLPEPSPDKLAAIVQAQLEGDTAEPLPAEWKPLAGEFDGRRQTQDLSTDQLLNALYLRLLGVPIDDQLDQTAQRLKDALLKPLTGGQST